MAQREALERKKETSILQLVLCLSKRVYIGPITFQSSSTDQYSVALDLTTPLFVFLSSFPSPARTSTVQTYRPASTNVQTEHQLARYERTVQVRLIVHKYDIS